MHLFEVTNGYTGESYVRVYVWAENEETALALAQQTYQLHAGQHGEKYWSTLHSTKLFSQGDGPFCTLPDDAGWETAELKH